MKVRTLHIIAFLTFLILAIITLRELLFSNAKFQYGDLVWPSDIKDLISSMSYTLKLDPLRRIIYLGPFFGSINFLGLSALIAQKLLFLSTRVMIGFIAYIAIYKFLSLKTEKANKYHLFAVSLFSGFFYAYNPVATTIISTSPAFAFSYSLIPLIFYFFDKTLNERGFYNIFITSLLVTFSIAGVMQFLVLLPISLLFPWFIVTCLQRRYLHKQVSIAIKNFGYVIILSFLMSFYWILPSLLTILNGVALTPSYVLTYDMLYTFSSEASLLNVFRLMGDWLPRVSLSPVFDPSLWTALTFIIPLALATSILFSKKLKIYLLSFSLIALFIIFFNKGLQPPISGFYPLLYDIPVVGWMFRVPQKFGVLLSFFVMITISIGLYNLLLLKVTRFTRYLKRGLILFLVFSISVVSWPMFTGNFGGIVSQNSYPLTNDLTYLKNDAYKAYFYPYDRYLAIDLPVAHYDSNQYDNLIVSKFGENVSIGKLLSPLNIKYIIVSKPFQENSVLQGLILKNETSSFLIFENPDYTDLINVYTTNILVFGGLDTLLALNSLDSFDSTTSALIFLDQNMRIFSSEVLNRIDKILINDKTSLIMPFIYKDSTIIAPFGATNRHKPREVWSIAMTSDPLHGPWHSYLESRGLDNWDFDYGKGLVFTWAPSKLENPTPTSA
ncbi:MAG: hypothetical protein ACFFDI_27845, partial [Promethearchaeota archaeon]